MTNEELVVKIQNGEDYLFESLLESNRGIVNLIIAQYRYINQSKEDIEAICHLEMWRAVQDFDNGIGKKFMSFAATYMRRALNWEITKERSQKRSTNLLSLDYEYDTDEDTSTLFDIIENEATRDIYSLANDKIYVEQLFHKTNSSENEKKIFEMIYIDGTDQTTVSKRLGKSRQYISKVDKGIQRKISDVLKDEENVS